MAGTRKPVPPATKATLMVAIAAALAALALAAALFDQQTESGTTTRRLFAILIGLALGPAPILVALGALIVARPPRRRVVRIALATLLFGAAMSWLFFVETSELPRLWPT